MPVFAHGPWYMEWHHLPDVWLMIGPSLAVVGVWLNTKLRK